MTTTEKINKVNEALASVSHSIFKVASISDMKGFQFDVVMNALHMTEDELRKQRDRLTEKQGVEWVNEILNKNR